MANKSNQSLIAIPPDIDDPVVLRRTLSKIVERLDVVIGNKSGTSKRPTNQTQVTSGLNNIETNYITDAPADGNNYVRRNGAWVIIP